MAKDIFENLNNMGNLLLIGGLAYIGYKVYQNFSKASAPFNAMEAEGAYFTLGEKILPVIQTGLNTPFAAYVDPQSGQMTTTKSTLGDLFGVWYNTAMSGLNPVNIPKAYTSAKTFLSGLAPQATPAAPIPEELKLPPSAVVQTMSTPQVTSGGKATYPSTTTKKSFYVAPKYGAGAPTIANAQKNTTVSLSVTPWYIR